MIEDYVSRAALPLVEVVHVELADEGIQIRMFEGAREYIPLKLFLAHYFEGLAVVGPPYGTSIISRLANFEQLFEEDRGHKAIAPLLIFSLFWDLLGFGQLLGEHHMFCFVHYECTNN